MYSYCIIYLFCQWHFIRIKYIGIYYIICEVLKYVNIFQKTLKNYSIFSEQSIYTVVQWNWGVSIIQWFIQGFESVKENSREYGHVADVIFDCQIILVYYNVEETYVPLLIYKLESLISPVKIVSP